MSGKSEHEPLILESLRQRQKRSICRGKMTYLVISHLLIFSIGILSGIVISSLHKTSTKLSSLSSLPSLQIDGNITESMMNENESLIEAEIRMDGNSENEEYNIPLRVVCLIPTLIPEKQNALKVIGESWGAHCDKLYFVIDDMNIFIPHNLSIFNGNILKLRMEHKQSKQDRNIWEKTWRMWHYAGTHLLNEGDFFFKIDDDSFFSAVNFRKFAQYFNSDGLWYFGHTLLNEWTNTNSVFNAGSCYALSRGALRKLYPIFETEAFLNDPERGRPGLRGYCVHRKGDNEDPTIAICLRSLGINPTNTLDHQYRDRFMIFQPTIHKTMSFQDYKRSEAWFVEHKHPKHGFKENCCSLNPISFHYFKNDYTKFITLDKEYNDGISNISDDHIPDKNLFLFNQETAPKHDEWLNAIHHIPKGQRIYLGPGKERSCYQCEDFTFK